MKLIRLQQGTLEWAAWRSQGVGASDATIVSEAPVPWDDPTTTKMLWAEKTGRAQRPDSTFAQRRGQRLEPIGRKMYEQRTGRHMPPVCAEHDTHSWCRASLDGLSEWGDIVLELKWPRWECHLEALEGIVPAHYVPQLAHQLYVTGADLLHYVSCSEKRECPDKDRFALVEVRPDPAYIRQLLVAEWAFWGRVQADWWPEEETAQAERGRTLPPSGLFAGGRGLAGMEVSR